MRSSDNKLYLVAIIKLVLISITLACSIYPKESKSQSIDSIEVNLSNHKTDTSFLRKSLIDLQKLPLIGSVKADSLVKIILTQSQLIKFS